MYTQRLNNFFYFFLSVAFSKETIKLWWSKKIFLKTKPAEAESSVCSFTSFLEREESKSGWDADQFVFHGRATVLRIWDSPKLLFWP